MTNIQRIFSTLAVCSVIALSGCSTTEETTAVDNRPRISFSTQSDPDLMRVWIDNVSYGTIASYMHNEAALRILPGTHTVTVSMPNGSMITQKVYVADGVTKTIQVP